MSGFFAYLSPDGSYVLTVPGYILIAVLIFAALILIARISSRTQKFEAKHLTYAAVAIALATVAALIRVFQMPFGGYITFFSMLFICLIGYWYGPAAGIMAGVAYGLLQLILDPYIISVPQLLVDYIFAFGALGLSGFFSEKKYGLLLGYLAGITGRFVFSVLSGVIFFGQFAPEGMNPFVYSCIYNGLYIYGEGILTCILLMVPAVSAALRTVRAQAVS